MTICDGCKYSVDPFMFLSSLRRVDCDDVTMWRLDCVTSWPCDEMTGSRPCDDKNVLDSVTNRIRIPHFSGCLLLCLYDYIRRKIWSVFITMCHTNMTKYKMQLTVSFSTTYLQMKITFPKISCVDIIHRIFETLCTVKWLHNNKS